MNQALQRLRRHLRAAVCVAVAASLQMQAAAQTVNVSNVPLAKSSSVAVRANLMFIMDTSGSMDWEFLPGADTGDSPLAWCFGFSGINRIFYDPTVTYQAPLNYDGTAMADMSFTAARDDGFNPSSVTRNLSTLANLSTPSSRYNANGDTSKYYYTTVATGQTARCSTTSDYTRWNIVRDATAWTAAQKTNYANWYSYYRSRMLLMRSAVGRVFAKIDATRFRVGYSAINSSSYADSTGFLPANDFDGASQKAKFFEKLYAAPASGSTPLRPALEKIGKYYAKRKMDGTIFDSTVADPVQYACQKNYALLSTDGYWNTSGESSASGRSNYGPTRMNGSTAIGNPDAASGVLRPFKDDGKAAGGNNWVVGGTGTSNTLADIAQYFYTTDLRQSSGPDGGTAFCTGSIAGQNVCDNVAAEGTEAAVTYQNMRTFTVGLGLAGKLTYRPDYAEATTGSFANIKAGTIPWPKVVADTDTAVDDLWHAAVNGRGKFFSASNSADLESGLKSALDNITEATGVAAAAATSSLQPVDGDNYMYIGEYTTVRWEGNIRAHTIDPASGAVSTTPQWEAKNTIKAQVAATSDTRNIFFRNPTNNAMTAFTGPNVTAAGLQADFTNLCVPQTGRPALSQCASFDATKKTLANSTDNMVNYLRGRSANENSASADLANRLYRYREFTPLGDIVNGSPVYVKRPPFKYSDAGYTAFKNANTGRQGVVYLAANDGMLHALNAETGSELWAYIPTMVMKHMTAVADENYATNHRYMVDGTPVVGDVYVNTPTGMQWRTILVGGLNSGGRGYYALDITDPAAPTVLWEITDAQEPNLGLSYGNPIITKSDAGAWIVAFTSGYNNTSPGDGNGHVFIRSAYTGAAINRVETFVDSWGTSAGTTSSPSNLAKLNAWVENETNNAATRLYAGDLKGNVWRIEYDGTTNTGTSANRATLLGYVSSPSGARQPISTKPMLAVVTNNKYPVVVVATGRYVSASDVGDTSTQSIWVFRDKMYSTGFGNLRGRTDMIKSTMSSPSKGIRRLSNMTMNWTDNLGWYVDLTLSAGERVNVDMVQTGLFLGVASNIPAPSACNPGGSSWVYSINLATAGSGAGNMTSLTLDTMTAGLNVVRLDDAIRLLVVDTNGGVTVGESRDTAGVSGTVKRRSWREVTK